MISTPSACDAAQPALTACDISEIVEREVAHRTAAFAAERKQIEALLEQADEELEAQMQRVQTLETQCRRQDSLLQRERDFMRELETSCDRLERELEEARRQRQQAADTAVERQAEAQRRHSEMVSVCVCDSVCV
jgi:phage shock protein A